MNNKITIWRMHLKPKPISGDLKDVLQFCKKNNLIGVGWSGPEYEFYSSEELTDFCDKLSLKDSKTANEIKNIIRPISLMETGDLIWTRLGGDGSIYYLCRVGKKTWKDRKVYQEHRDFDVANFIEVEWLEIGGISDVPGKVVNSLSVSRTVQRISSIETLSKIYWNKYSLSNQHKYEVEKYQWNDFWEDINSDELETLVFLFLQNEGYYVYTGTVKLSTAKIEGVLINKNDYRLCYPQVKKNIQLLPCDYKHLISESLNNVVLFTTSENYGNQAVKGIRCLYQGELEIFIKQNICLLPASIKRRVEGLDLHNS